MLALASRLATLAVVALLAAPRAHAGGFGIPDLGVRRTAMAAVVGRPDEGAAIYHNPAGLILQHGWHLYVSGGAFKLDTRFSLHAWDQSDRFLGVTAGADGYYQPTRPTRALGVVPMIGVTNEVLPDRLVLGAAIYVGNAQGAAFRDDAVTRYHLIDGYVVAPQAMVAAAYRVSDTLALGASAGVLYLRIHGRRLVYPILDGTDVSGIVGSDPMLELDGNAWAPAWTVSAYGHPHPRVTWGATIMSRIDASLEGPVSVTYGDDAPTPGDQLIGTQRTNQLIPWTFLAGVNVDVTHNVEVGAETRYWLYRQYREQRIELTGIFLLRSVVTEKNFHDAWQVSGGVRVHDLPALPGLDLMLGLHTDHSPAPPKTLTLDQPSFDHVGLHSGVRYTIGRYRLGASYLRYWYDVPTVTDSTTTPPTNFKGTGTGQVFTLSMEARL